MINRNTKIYFSPKFSLEKKPQQIKHKFKYTKKQREIPKFIKIIKNLYGKDNINFYNHLAQELVDENIYDNFEEAYQDAKLLIEEETANKGINENLKNILNQRIRLHGWFREWFNLGCSIRKIKKNDQNFSLIIVVPSIDMVASIIASGYISESFKDLTDNIKTEKLEEGAINKLFTIHEEKQLNKFFLYKKTHEHTPTIVSYLGKRNLNMFDSTKEFSFNKYIFTRGAVELYKFIDNKISFEIPSYQLENHISIMPKDYIHRNIKPGTRFVKKNYGLAEYFFNENQIQNIEKERENFLCRIYGITGYLQRDLYRSHFIIEDSDNKKTTGRLNDLVRADWLGQFQNQLSQIISPRAKKSHHKKYKDCELVIFQGADSYLKFSSMNIDKNCIVLLSPDENDFESAIGMANNDYSLSSKDLTDEYLLKFANKYPTMGFWK